MDTDKRLKEIRMRTVENKLLFEDSNALAYDVVDKTFDYGVFALENVPFLLDEIERLNKLLRFRVCSCGWTGREFQTLDYKHETGARMCPECHEQTEVDEGE